MKIVIDTNVLVSAVLFDNKPEKVISFIAGCNDIDWIVTSDIMNEYIEVLSRPKFALLPDEFAAQIDFLANVTKTVLEPKPALFSRDPKDARFIALVRAENVDVFLTGDRDFNAAPDDIRIKCRTVSQLLMELGLT